MRFLTAQSPLTGFHHDERILVYPAAKLLKLVDPCLWVRSACFFVAERREELI